jgi:hypothetical protein
MTREYSQAKPGTEYGLRLHIRHGAETPAVFEIKAVEDFEFPDLSAPQIDTTHMRSPGNVGEVINGPRPALIFDLPLQYWEGVSYEATLRTLIGSGDVVEFLITLGSSYRGFATRVLHYDPTAIPMREKAMATLKLAIMAEITDPTALPT